MITQGINLNYFKGTKETLVFYDSGTQVIARIYHNGIVETHQGYSPELVAERILCAVRADWDSLSFFSKDGVSLVTLYRDGRVVYRDDYKPDAIARELWETLGRVVPSRGG